MNQRPSPLLGFNNNVKHNGRVFHIQTEDSGTKYCRIVTHLFADGGRILRTVRTDYADRADQPGLSEKLRVLMKQQHRAMFVALRAGEFDQLIEKSFETGTPTTLSIEGSVSQTDAQERDDLPPMSLPGAEMRSGTPSMRESQRPSRRPQRPSKRPSTASPAGPGVEQSAKTVSSRAPSQSVPKLRPAMAANDPLSCQANKSLFGDSAADEASIGEVILSYVEDTPNKGSA